jgi:hypothetical protein
LRPPNRTTGIRLDPDEGSNATDSSSSIYLSSTFIVLRLMLSAG